MRSRQPWERMWRRVTGAKVSCFPLTTMIVPTPLRLVVSLRGLEGSYAGLRNPITGIACCGRTASGHAAAAGTPWSHHAGVPYSCPTLSIMMSMIPACWCKLTCVDREIAKPERQRLGSVDEFGGQY
jgi:hypothetical protein